MSNPQLGFDELAAAQEQPEVLVNAADRAISAAVGGQITIDFSADADLTLQATVPPDPGDQWAFGTIVMTDTGVVLTGPANVVYPDVDTLYGGPSRLVFMFVNETAQSLTLLRTGQVGVTVAAGAAALVWHNGADIRLLTAVA